MSTRGSWSPYLLFFLEACRTQSEDAAKRARSLLDLRNRWREQVQEVGRSVAALAAVDQLFIAPVFTISRLAKEIRVTFAAASRVVARLESLEMVRERTGKKRDRVFIAEPVLRIVQRR